MKIFFCAGGGTKCVFVSTGTNVYATNYKSKYKEIDIRIGM
jgi:hypothetical protein